MRNHSGSEWTLQRWQWRGNLHFPRLLYYWSLTIRLLGVFPVCAEMQLVYSIAPADLVVFLCLTAYQPSWVTESHKNTSRIAKKKLVTVVEGDLKVPFSIATIPRCREGHYSFPWIVTLDTHLIILSDNQEPFSESFVWHSRGLNPGFQGHWRTLYLLGQ